MRSRTVLLLLVLVCLGRLTAHGKEKKKATPLPEPPHSFIQPSQKPAFSIPVGDLGFAAPGALYEGLRYSFTSLDFLDETHLLFTFRVPGLLRRQGDDSDEEPRNIRALVLTLPSGAVQSEALWTLHGHERYLWMLDNGHYLIRDDRNILEGDASLALKTLFHFPGPVTWMEMDPAQQFLVTNSYEPRKTVAHAGDVESPETAQADMTSDAPESLGDPRYVVRILERGSGKVMLVSRARATVHLPINREGYLEVLRGKEREWILNFNYFTGGSRIVGAVDSECAPSLEFVAPETYLATGCDDKDGRAYVALNMDGKRLWEVDSPSTQVWPRLVRGPKGLRFAIESLAVPRAVNAMQPLSFQDVKGQLVEVFDTATGKRLLTAPADPILDGGGNVAISASGNRVAVLNQGAIEVYLLTGPQWAHVSAKGASGK
ncbi:MAG: hypothetical protein KGN79_04900 [Acidobacteriota bacterium]|nr:hypothetical protein [Acidobacteriota bacterium]